MWKEALIVLLLLGSWVPGHGLGTEGDSRQDSKKNDPEVVRGAPGRKALPVPLTGPPGIVTVNVLLRPAVDLSFVQPLLQSYGGLNGSVRDNFFTHVTAESSPSLGIVLDDKGHILTYLGYRWVELKTPDCQVEVMTPDGEKVAAQMVGVDEQTGLGVVRASTANLRPARWAAGAAPGAGETVYAYDRMTALRPRVIRGQVQGRNPSRNTYLVSLDQAPGEGMKPVVNAEKRLIGFTTGRYLSQGENPMAQVYPIQAAVERAQRIILHGKDIPSGWLGVKVEEVPREVMTASKIQGGARITQVVEDSPAAEAGLTAGDFLLRYDRTRVENVPHLIQLIQASAIGQRVVLTALRAGKILEIAATIGERRRDGYAVYVSLPENFREKVREQLRNQLRLLRQQLKQMETEGAQIQREQQAKLVQETDRREEQLRVIREREADLRAVERRLQRVESAIPPVVIPKEFEVHFPADHETGRRPSLGVFADNLTPQLADYFQAPPGLGVLVTAVVKDSPAEKAGLRAGDVLVKMDGEEIRSRVGLSRALSGKRFGDEVTLSLVRDRKPREMKFRLEEKGADGIKD